MASKWKDEGDFMIPSMADDLPYRVGGLLYMPAFQKNIVPKIRDGSIPCLTSIAFCLEDAIRASALAAAEASLHGILAELQALAAQGTAVCWGHAGYPWLKEARASGVWLTLSVKTSSKEINFFSFQPYSTTSTSAQLWQAEEARKSRQECFLEKAVWTYSDAISSNPWYS